MDLNALERNLRKLAEDNQKKKQQDEALRNAKNEEDRKRVMDGITQNLGQIFQPYIEKLQANSQMSAEELKRIITQAVKVEVPSIDTKGIEQILGTALGNIKLPAPHVKVEVPPVKMPPFTWPTGDMPIRGWVQLMGVDLNHPLPVQIRDKDGNVVNFGGGGGGMMGGGSGGAVKVNNNTNEPIPVQIVSGAGATSAVNIVDSNGVAYSGSNPLPTTASVTLSAATGQGDSSAALRTIQGGDSISSFNMQQTAGNATVVGTGYQDNALRVVNATDAVTSVNITSSISLVVSSITNSTAAALVDSSGVAYSGSNPLPTTATLSTPQGQGDAATAMRVVVAGNSDASVSVNAWNNNAVTVGSGYQDNALRVVMATDAIASVNNVQWNGNTITVGTGYQDNALRVVNATDAVTSVNIVSSVSLVVTSITNSTAAALIDSSGIQYSGSNPVPVTLISGALTSTLSVGDSAARTADNGGNPVKVGGIARSTNPSKYADGNRSNFGTDLIGRQLMRPVQVRDLILSSYTTISTGTETTLLTAAAGTYADLIYIMAANTSSAAQQLDIRAVSGGNIVMTLEIPANGTVGIATPVPLPQSDTGNAWTADMGDVTNSNILVTALYSKEI